MNLTKRLLKAMHEAIEARLAGEIDVEDNVERRDYEDARDWIKRQLEQRSTCR